MSEAIEFGFFLIEKIIAQIEKRSQTISVEEQNLVKGRYEEIKTRIEGNLKPESWKVQPLGE